MTTGTFISTAPQSPTSLIDGTLPIELVKPVLHHFRTFCVVVRPRTVLWHTWHVKRNRKHAHTHLTGYAAAASTSSSKHKLRDSLRNTQTRRFVFNTLSAAHGRRSYLSRNSQASEFGGPWQILFSWCYCHFYFVKCKVGWFCLYLYLTFAHWLTLP